MERQPASIRRHFRLMRVFHETLRRTTVDRHPVDSSAGAIYEEAAIGRAGRKRYGACGIDDLTRGAGGGIEQIDAHLPWRCGRLEDDPRTGTAPPQIHDRLALGDEWLHARTVGVHPPAVARIVGEPESAVGEPHEPPVAVRATAVDRLKRLRLRDVADPDCGGDRELHRRNR